MPRWLWSIGLLLSISTTAAAPPSIDLHGTSRSGDRPQPNTVVWLDAQDVSASTPRPNVVLDQRNLTFSPHVLAVRVGTVVEFPNDDRVFHNVFSFHDGKRFDLGLYPVGTVRHVAFDRPGLSRIFCNIHPNMTAYVMAIETRYFSVSDQGGHFTIAGVVPGTYPYHAWRPGRAELAGSTVVQAGTSLEIRWP